MKRLIAVLAALAFGLLSACSEDEPKADFVVLGGTIYSGDETIGTVEALAAIGGLIIDTGTTEEMRQWIGDDTHIVDLQGRFAMAGFNDAHTHMANAGLAMLAVDVTGAGSVGEFQQRIRDRLGDFEPGRWVTGRGWDHSLWPGAEVPTRADLDAVSTAHPILMGRVDGHSAVANSMALELAGIDADTPDPEGGDIVRDAAGEATGWLKESAVQLVAKHVPPPSADDLRQGLRLAIADAARHGVTSVQDDSVRGSGWPAFEALKALKDAGELTVRVTEWLPFEASIDQLKTWRQAGGTTDAWLKTGALKGVADGSGGSLSAAMIEPFATAPDNRGLLLIGAELMAELAIERDANDFQIAIHAIGDRANRVALGAFEAAARANGERDSRHRIEHAQFVDDDDLGRFKALGVVASMQPSHILSDMRWAPRILGPEREGEGYRWNGLLKSGARLAFGSDYPVEPIDPMRGLYAAITREFEAGGPVEGGWQAQEKITIEEAIAAFTLGAAFAEFEDDRKGTLRPGKFADIVVLTRDIIRASPAEILDTEVLITIVGGEVVYQRH